MSDDSSKSQKTALSRLISTNCTPSQIQPIIQHLLSPITRDGAPKPMAAVFIWGAMGIGKTDIVRQTARAWGRRVVALHLPQYDPTDIKGIPVRMDDGRVQWVASSYLPQQYQITTGLTKKGQQKIEFGKLGNAEDVEIAIRDLNGNLLAWLNSGIADRDLKGPIRDYQIAMREGTITLDSSEDLGCEITIMDKAVLFLDELSAADPTTQNAALQLVLDRQLNEYRVPEGVAIIAAGNRESDAAFVQQMSAPLANRFCHIRMIPSTEDFINYAMNHQMHPAIIGYIGSQQKGGLYSEKDSVKLTNEALFSFDPSAMVEGDCGFTTPRSWTLFSQQFDPSLPTDVNRVIASGFLGVTHGEGFINHFLSCANLPDPSDILDGKITEIPDDVPKSGLYTITTNLSYRFRMYYDRLYNADKKASEQTQEWHDVVQNYLEFLDKLGHELSMMAMFTITQNLDIKMSHLRSKAFEQFSVKYGNIFAKLQR